MQAIIGETAGFCFGVKNAVDKAEENLKQKDKLYCLGELVHNKQVTEDLEKKGMIFVENIEDAKDVIVIRAHGIPKETYEKAKEKEIKLIDLTCPKVLQIHKIAQEYLQKGYYIFYVGQKNHPETIGTLSFCGDDYAVLENIDDAKIGIEEFQKSNKEKAVIIAQTTYSLEKFNKIAEEIKEKLNEKLEIKNTICNATKVRQEETEIIARDVDTMIIIGGRHSSNSNKLNEIAKKYCKNVLFIETVQEININRLKNSNKIGIMAGASTPKESIDEIVDIINKMC